MSIDELIERLQWLKEDKLQHRVRTPNREYWEDVTQDSSCGLVPSINCRASDYRMRPEAPQMPDEVFLPAYPSDKLAQPVTSQSECFRRFPYQAPVRYVRAGAVIPRNNLQVRSVARRGESWSDLVDNGYEYRIKP